MGFFDKLFGSKKPVKPEAVAASADKGAVCSPAAGVAKAGYKDIIMTIITNSDDLAGIEKVAEGQVVAGTKLMQTA